MQTKTEKSDLNKKVIVTGIVYSGKEIWDTYESERRIYYHIQLLRYLRSITIISSFHQLPVSIGFERRNAYQRSK